MAYTNRAVDEICSMLANSHHDFIRMGSAHRCDPRFHGNLIANIIEQNPRLDAISRRILQTPIIVGTTATLLSHPEIFNLRTFTLAVIDEASQILEPDIIGLLSAHKGNQCCIHKFILIGDHKQLPAVVQQYDKDSRTDDPLLQSIGLTNCRQSLFERLLRTSPESVKGVLHKQGRMHPAIAEFPCRMFYPNEHLEPVPLQHQQEPAHANLLFIPSQFCKIPGLSDKVNTDEAQIVAKQLQRIYDEYGESFDPNTTVGVIVPYRNQIAVIRREIEKLKIPALLEISIDTVERYQGSQRDVIIYSFTVQNMYQLEFLTANCFIETDNDGSSRLIDRKLNVALTRARKQLIVTGNPQILSANPLFRNLMEQLQENI
jgi:superfamily I DNA and/or RNA helicase